MNSNNCPQTIRAAICSLYSSYTDFYNYIYIIILCLVFVEGDRWRFIPGLMKWLFLTAKRHWCISALMVLSMQTEPNPGEIWANTHQAARLNLDDYINEFRVSLDEFRPESKWREEHNQTELILTDVDAVLSFCCRRVFYQLWSRWWCCDNENFGLGY